MCVVYLYVMCVVCVYVFLMCVICEHVFTWVFMMCMMYVCDVCACVCVVHAIAVMCVVYVYVFVLCVWYACVVCICDVYECGMYGSMCMMCVDQTTWWSWFLPFTFVLSPRLCSKVLCMLCALTGPTYLFAL